MTSGYNSKSKRGCKRKEVCTYTAPWPLYALNWSMRPDKRLRLAVGSFIEDYKNKVYFLLHSIRSIVFIEPIGTIE